MVSAICPKCGRHNCSKLLNYCSGCGYSFKAERELKGLIIDNSTGQTSLFDMKKYEKKVWRDL